MGNGVILKGIGHSISIVVDLKVDIEKLSSEINTILDAQFSYFEENSVNLKFIKTGDSLNDNPKINALQKIVLNKNLVIGDNGKLVEIYKDINKTKIINKSIRAGSTVEFDGNLVLFGDVNPGAIVVVSGSFICINGCVHGKVYVGQDLSGNKKEVEGEVFLYAEKINSPQIKIKNEMYCKVKSKKCFYSE